MKETAKITRDGGKELYRGRKRANVMLLWLCIFVAGVRDGARQAIGGPEQRKPDKQGSARKRVPVLPTNAAFNQQACIWSAP